MESCKILDLDWERWGLWANSVNNNDGIFDFSSSLDDLLTSDLVDGNNSDAKSDVFAKWMDEKMDLSTMHLESQSGLLDDLDVMIEDPATILDIMMGAPSDILESDLEVLNFKSDKNDGSTKEASEFAATPDSPGGRVPDNSFALSPEYQQESFYKSVSPENPSPGKEIVEEIDHLASYLKGEANSVDVPTLSPNFNHSQLSPSVSVSSLETLDSVDSKDSYDKIEAQCSSSNTDLARAAECVHFRFDSHEDNAMSEESEIPEVGHKTKTRSQNHKRSVSNRRPPAGEFRRERKRKQNKDAATRYRQKKRKESMAIKTEETVLAERNQELKSRVQQLSNEISYLKGLLKEAKLRMQSS
ncbi:cyclic AMP-dependent transcription factor ATF-4 [Centruroides vittatus]|uniref:cyclic AMP-dependent transcription factor ATF-4 n=1 Tax=Centruroides vittatus TaxID=120091 RepID=UPI00350F8658